MLVLGYRDLPDKVTSPAGRAAIDNLKTGPIRAFNGRIVQLVEPIYFFDKLRDLKEGRSSVVTKTTPAPVRVIPVPLRD